MASVGGIGSTCYSLASSVSNRKIENDRKDEDQNQVEYRNYHRQKLVSHQTEGTEMQVSEGRSKHSNLSFVTPILFLNHISISKHFKNS